MSRGLLGEVNKRVVTNAWFRGRAQVETAWPPGKRGDRNRPKLLWRNCGNSSSNWHERIEAWPLAENVARPDLGSW